MRVEGGKISLDPRFDRESWDDVEFVWNNKPFIKVAVPEILRFPLVDSIDTVNQSLLRKAYTLNVIPNDDQALLLRHPVSPWKEEVLLAVNQPIEDKSLVRITGTFRSKVYEGKSSRLRSFIRQMEAHLATRDERALGYYINRVGSTLDSDNNEIVTYVIIAQVTNLRKESDPPDVDRWFPFT